MKRQDKYPETNTFHYYNANPKNRITADCTIRAIAIACDIPYNQVVMDFANMQCETGYHQATNQGISILLKKYGWIKHNQPRKDNNTKYTGKEFCTHLAKSNCKYIVNIGGHHIVAIVDCKVWDIWDSTDGCIGNYWSKY